MTPGQAAGRVVRELRLSAGWTQEATARRLRSLGLDWTRDQLTVLETGRRQDLTITEAVLLAEAFRIPVPALFADRGQVDLGGRTMALAELQDRLSASPPAGPGADEEAPYSLTEKAWARQLGLLPDEVRAAAGRYWGETVDGQVAAIMVRLYNEGRGGDDMASLESAEAEAFADLERVVRSGKVTVIRTGEVIVDPFAPELPEGDSDLASNEKP